MPLLFSYGMLQQEEVQLATFGRRLDGWRDEIVGFQRSTVRIEDPGVVARVGRTHFDDATFTGDAGHRLEGIVFEVSEGELASADGFEAPFAYARISAALASGVRAWVYVHRGGGAPSP